MKIRNVFENIAVKEALETKLNKLNVTEDYKKQLVALNELIEQEIQKTFNGAVTEEIKALFNILARTKEEGEFLLTFL